MQELTVVLGITAALLHGIAYVLYSVQTKLGYSKPNIATWSIWTFLATLNAFSYREMSGDAIVALQFFTGSVACTLTFVYAMIIGKFSWPKQSDWWCFALGLLAMLVWWIFRSATGANMIILVAALVSFIPTYMGVARDPFRETPGPWVLWTFAFLVTTINVVLREDKLVALVMPTVLLVAHAGIAVLSTKERKARFNSARA